MFYALFFQIILDPVGNIAFGNGAKVDLRIGICQLYGIVLDVNIFIVDVGERFLNGVTGRNHLRFLKIPQA